MIPPACQFQAIVSKPAGLFADLLKLQIRPLAGEQRDETSHALISFACNKLMRQRRFLLVKSRESQPKLASFFHALVY
jgi:hypothetical protein